MMGCAARQRKVRPSWLSRAWKASAGTFADAAAFGEIIFNCTKGEASPRVLNSAGAALDGKILIDVANPLDFSRQYAAGTDACAWGNFQPVGR